jgi:hypothetical protein
MGVATDDLGNVYNSGRFGGTVDFNPGAAVYNLSAAGVDPYVVKLNNSGSFIWAKQFPCAFYKGNDAHEITVAPGLGIIVTGRFESTVDFDPGPSSYYLTSAGSWDNFITVLDTAGNFIWANQIGGNTLDNSVNSVADAQGNVYNAGFFQATADFDPGPGTYNIT